MEPLEPPFLAGAGVRLRDLGLPEPEPPKKVAGPQHWCRECFCFMIISAQVLKRRKPPGILSSLNRNTVHGFLVTNLSRDFYFTMQQLGYDVDKTRDFKNYFHPLKMLRSLQNFY